MLSEKNDTNPLNLRAAAAAALLALSGTLGKIAIEVGLLGLSSQLYLFLLGHGVEVCCQDEPDESEEGLPHDGGQVVLRNGNGNRAGGPGDSHHGPESSLDGPLNVLDTSGTVDVGHAREVDYVGKHRNGEVGGDDLKDLVTGGGAAGKSFLKEASENVTHGSRDEEAVDEHLECTLVDAELGSVGLEEADGVLLSLTLLFVERGGSLGVGGSNTGKVTGKHFRKSREDTRCDHPIMIRGRIGRSDTAGRGIVSWQSAKLTWCGEGWRQAPRGSRQAAG